MCQLIVNERKVGFSPGTFLVSPLFIFVFSTLAGFSPKVELSWNNIREDYGLWHGRPHAGLVFERKGGGGLRVRVLSAGH